MPRSAYRPFTFEPSLRQLHEAEIGQPEPGEIGRLALRRGRVGPPAVPDAPIAVAGLERPLEGISRRLELEGRVDVDLALVVADGQLAALQRKLEGDDLAGHVGPSARSGPDRVFHSPENPSDLRTSGPANTTRNCPIVIFSVSREWTGNHRSPLTSISLTQAIYPAESNFFRVLS